MNFIFASSNIFPLWYRGQYIELNDNLILSITFMTTSKYVSQLEQGNKCLLLSLEFHEYNLYFKKPFFRSKDKYLDLQKNCKAFTGSSHTPPGLLSPLLSMLVWYICHHQLTSIGTLLLIKACSLFIFPQFLPNARFCFRLSFEVPHCIQSSCLPRLLLAVTVFHIFLFCFMTLTVLRHTGRRYFRMLLY